MSDGTKKMRENISLLEAISVNEHDFDDAAPGVETKVEVTFKDDNHVDVNVHTDGGDELNRLMDLAGVFHSGKGRHEVSTDDMPAVVEPTAEPSADYMDDMPTIDMDPSPEGEIEFAPDMDGGVEDNALVDPEVLDAPEMSFDTDGGDMEISPIG